LVKIMNYFAFLMALVRLVSELIQWAAHQSVTKTQAANALSKAIQAAREDVNHAKSVSDHLRAELDAHPERLRDTDGFKRRE
jgi:beta-lactamase regulating signal transducer with metallopeptidase domain